MKPKMRIQLLDDSGVTISDRLVDQYSELLNGPTETHKDPFKLEITIDSKETMERLKGYLEKLVGNLPLVIRSSSSKSTSNKSMNPYKEIFNDIKAKEHIEQIIEYLESLNFRWVTYQFLQEANADGKFPKLAENPAYPRYQWLVRMLRQAKDPGNDRYDWSMMIGIKFMPSPHKGLGEVPDRVFVIYKGENKAVLDRSWEKYKSINMKKKKIPLIFPQYMTIEERKRWRYMHRKVKSGKTLGTRDDIFYKRYLPEVENLDANPTIKLTEK